MPYDTKEKRNEYQRKYYKKNKEKLKKYKHKYYRTPKGKMVLVKGSLKFNYNITLGEYDRMLELQNGVCAICKLPQLYKRLAVDHDHKSGKIRGLLCNSCNILLGCVERKPNLISDITKYLKAT